MIKLAMMCTDEASQARLQDCLRGETDISVIGSMVIQNILHESERGLAFMNKMVKLSPHVAILDQDILRETAALSMPVVIEYMQKLSFTRRAVPDIEIVDPRVIAATSPVEPRPNSCEAERLTSPTSPLEVEERARTELAATFCILA